MIRKNTAKITIIIASFALPMLPNATIEMYIISNIRNMRERMKTIMMMKGDDDHDDDQGDDDDHEDDRS